MKTRHLSPGLRPEPLASYLAGLGLIRVLGEQADPDASAAWTPDGLALTTTIEDSRPGSPAATCPRRSSARGTAAAASAPRTRSRSSGSRPCAIIPRPGWPFPGSD